MVSDDAAQGFLAAQGFVRVKDLDVDPPRRVKRYCDCAAPDVWVRAESQGNNYRCGICGRAVLGQEG